MKSLSCDPGANGAIALFHDGKLVKIADLPTIKVGGRTKLVPGSLANILIEWEPDVAILEEVGAMPRDGAVGAFSFGRNFGQIEGVISALNIGLTFVRPAVWKRRAGLIGVDKSKSRMMASQLWPDFADKFSRAKDVDRAEACLIGRFGGSF